MSRLARSRPPKPEPKPAPPRIEDLPDVMRVEQAAKFLQLGRRQTYDAIHAGQIPAVRIGRTIRILKSALLAALGDPGVGGDTITLSGGVKVDIDPQAGDSGGAATILV